MTWLRYWDKPNEEKNCLDMNNGMKFHSSATSNRNDKAKAYLVAELKLLCKRQRDSSLYHKLWLFKYVPKLIS